MNAIRLPLPLDDDPDRHALDPARRETLLHLAPQDRGDLVPVEAVQDAARLLGLDQAKIELPGVGERLFDGMLGDLVEDHPMHRDLGLQRLGQVPGDRLPFAVLVGRQVELVDVGEHLLEHLHPFPSLLGHHVQGLEVVVDVDSEAGPVSHPLAFGGISAADRGQVANMAHRRLDRHLGSEESGDGSGLRRGLDDDEALRHGCGELTSCDRAMSIRTVSGVSVTVCLQWQAISPESTDILRWKAAMGAARRHCRP